MISLCKISYFKNKVLFFVAPILFYLFMQNSVLAEGWEEKRTRMIDVDLKPRVLPVRRYSKR